MTNPAVPPSVVPPSPDEWPNTLRTITGIARDNITTVTCPDHGFTSADIGVTSVMFQQVKGMIQINGLPGVIQSVPSTSVFTVNIDSTNFFSYTSAGVINILTGQPPSETVGFQIFNTPFANIA